MIGNGANDSLFRPDATFSAPDKLPPRYVIFFGALSPWQGVDLMLAAATHPSWPADVALVIAGDGGLEPLVRSVADGERVVALGTVPYADLPGVVTGSIASLVLSSRPDDVAGLSPLKMYESMACAVPIVVLDRPGTADTVREHGCGVIVDDDPVSVASAVSRLAAEPAHAISLGLLGRAAVEARYSWSARAAATERVIARVVERA